MTLTLYTRGIALESILKTKEGKAFFPQVGRCTVIADEDVDQYDIIIVVADKNHVIPYSLVTREKRFDKDDYASLTTGPTLTEYVIGTKANEADKSVLLFEAKNIVIRCSQDVYIRFNAPGRVRHLIPADVFFEYTLRVDKLFYQQVSVAGTLEIWAEG